MNELDDLQRRSERRTEAQLAAQRKRIHGTLERMRARKDRGGSLFEPPRPQTPALNPHPDGGFYVQPGDKGDR